MKNLLLAFEVGVDACLGQAGAFGQALHRYGVVCPIRELDQSGVQYFLFPGGRGQVATLAWYVIFLAWHSKTLFEKQRHVLMAGHRL